MTLEPSINGYREFLAARDGEPNLARHTLSNREEFFFDLQTHPVRSKRWIDHEAFLRNLKQDRPDPELDDAMLWLLATAKANQAERFGVGLGELYGVIRQDPDDENPEGLHVALQEHYHTRILADVIEIFGLPVHARPPGKFMRMGIKLMVFAPERVTLPLIGASEMAGCVLFRALRDRGKEIFADEPEVAQRIGLLYDEILADEIGHVGYIAARLGPVGRRLMRLLYRAFGARLATHFPEMKPLFGKREVRRMFREPFRLGRMVAELPGRAYAAAMI